MTIQTKLYISVKFLYVSVQRIMVKNSLFIMIESLASQLSERASTLYDVTIEKIIGRCIKRYVDKCIKRSVILRLFISHENFIGKCRKCFSISVNVIPNNVIRIN